MSSQAQDAYATTGKHLATPDVDQHSLPPSEKTLVVPDADERSIAPSDSISVAPLLGEEATEAAHNADTAAGPADKPRRKSILQRFKDERAERKAVHRNLYDNGPFHFVFDPVLGKEVLRKNPNWPYEGSEERENSGLTVKKGHEGMPDFVKQQTGKWGQTSDSSAQEYLNGAPAGFF